MIRFVKGKVAKVDPKNITLDVHGIGYEIFVPNPFYYTKEEDVYVVTYQHIREDEMSLYGFESEEQRTLFLHLLSVKGIGPKTALAIIAADGAEYIITAIETNDVSYLMRFPKVGKKAAMQIILDLKGKIEQHTDTAPTAKEHLHSQNEHDVIEALLALGYNAKEVRKAVQHIDIQGTPEQAIKQALTYMLTS